MEHEATVFLKRPLNKLQFTCRDVEVSAIYGFLKDIRDGGEYHDHISYELHLIKEGSGWMRAAGQQYPMTSDMLILIPPHTGHCPVPDGLAAFEDLTVMFTYRQQPDRTGEQGMYQLMEDILPQKDQVVSLRNAFYGECFRQIREAEAEQVLGEALLQNRLESLLLHLLKDLARLRTTETTAPPAAAVTGERMANCDFLVVKRIDEYIQRLSPDVTLDGLAAYINMSRRSTQRLVSGLYGQSFTRKLAEFRLNAAVELMKKEEKTLAEIAGEVGYEEYTTFHKAFLKRFGVQPSEYRRNRKG